MRKIWCLILSATGVSKFSLDELALREDEEQRVEVVNLQSGHENGGIIAPGAGTQKFEFGNSDRYSLDGGAIGLNNFDSGGLELPNIHENNAPQVSDLLYNQASSGSVGTGDIQIPGMDPIPKTEDVGEDTGLMFPKIGQADGTIEFTMNLGHDEAANVFKSIRKREIREKLQTKGYKLGQADGADDFDDDDDVFNDSDDINSDLDDEVESDREDDDVGQDEGQIMLCLYDKVQRIKNKWKSTLKEGIANINGRDYVFQKATGESEW